MKCQHCEHQVWQRDGFPLTNIQSRILVTSQAAPTEHGQFILSP
jgi:hypothetical protein